MVFECTLNQKKMMKLFLHDDKNGFMKGRSALDHTRTLINSIEKRNVLHLLILKTPLNNSNRY